jgi:hypothetical protein
MTPARRTGPAGVVCLLAFEVAAVALLHRLGGLAAAHIDWSHPGEWLRVTAPEDAAVGVLRLVGLVGAYWLLATSALYLGGRVAHVPRVVAGVRWATLPGVRRIIDGALAASIVGASALGPGVAHASPPPTRPPVVVQLTPPTTAPPPVAGVSVPLSVPGHVYVPVPAGDPSRSPQPPHADRSHGAEPTTVVPSTTSTTMPPPSTTSTRPPALAPMPAAPVPESAPRAPQQSSVYVVQPPDNLWTIAAQRVADATGRPVVRLGEREIAVYWLKVCDANRDRIPSGNLNLIHPGETVILPPVGA